MNPLTKKEIELADREADDYAIFSDTRGRFSGWIKCLIATIDQRDERIKELEKQLKLFKQTFGIKQNTIIGDNK